MLNALFAESFYGRMLMGKITASPLSAMSFPRYDDICLNQRQLCAVINDES